MVMLRAIESFPRLLRTTVIASPKLKSANGFSRAPSPGNWQHSGVLLAAFPRSLYAPPKSLASHIGNSDDRLI